MLERLHKTCRKQTLQKDLSPGQSKGDAPSKTTTWSVGVSGLTLLKLLFGRVGKYICKFITKTFETEKRAKKMVPVLVLVNTPIHYFYIHLKLQNSLTLWSSKLLKLCIKQRMSYCWNIQEMFGEREGGYDLREKLRLKIHKVHTRLKSFCGVKLCVEIKQTSDIIQFRNRQKV